MSQQLQLAFDFGGRDEHVRGSVVPTRALKTHRSCNNVLRRVHYVRRFFPELSERVIRVGLTRAASGMAVPGSNEIWLKPSGLSYHTVAHELVHLLQGSHGIPTGERSCDVYALARHWTLNDTPPYYVRVPAELLDVWGRIQPASAILIYRVAASAIERRRNGVRNYIAYFEKSLREIVRAPRAIATL
jgi:hypothetical protein